MWWTIKTIFPIYKQQIPRLAFISIPACQDLSFLSFRINFPRCLTRKVNKQCLFDPIPLPHKHPHPKRQKLNRQMDGWTYRQTIWKQYTLLTPTAQTYFVCVSGWGGISTDKKERLRPHSHYILNPDQLDMDQIDPNQIDLHQIAFTLGLIWCRSRRSTSSCVHTMGNLIQNKLIRLMQIKFILLQCERNNSVYTNLIWINLMQIKLIWINLVHSVNATWCGPTWSGSTWLLVWTQFDPDQLDLNQIDLDQVSSVNAA